MKCPKCEKDTLQHLHATAYGIPGTHMAGSERYECECGFHVGNREDAEEFGLIFFED